MKISIFFAICVVLIINECYAAILLGQYSPNNERLEMEARVKVQGNLAKEASVIRDAALSVNNYRKAEKYDDKVAYYLQEQSKASKRLAILGSAEDNDDRRSKDLSPGAWIAASVAVGAVAHSGATKTSRGVICSAGLLACYGMNRLHSSFFGSDETPNAAPASAPSSKYSNDDASLPVTSVQYSKISTSVPLKASIREEFDVTDPNSPFWYDNY